MILSLALDVLNNAAKPGSPYYCHPEYMARWWWREFNRLSYVGGREYSRPTRLTVEFDYPVQRYNADGTSVLRNSQGQAVDPISMRTSYPSMLFRHTREKEWEYENRRRRAHYHNIVATTINSLVSHALKKGVMRTGDEALMEFWKAVDCHRKTDIDTFMRDGLRMAEVEGIMWAFVDVDTRKPGATEQTADGKPYVYWVNPLDILDWSVDDDGGLVWIKQFIYAEGKRTPNDVIKPIHRFRIWYADHVDEFDVDANSQTEGPITRKENPLGRIPCEPLYAKKNYEAAFPDGDPIASDLAKSANAIFNYASLLDEILYKQTFSWLVVPDKNVDAVQIGTSTVFGYDSLNGGGRPEYVAPDPEQARVLMEAITGELSRARQAFGIGQPSDGSKQKSSAAALELENEDKRSILGDISSSGQDFELRLAALIDAYRNPGATLGKPTATRIEYPADFDLQALQDEVAEGLSLRSIGMSPEIMLVIRKSLAGRKLGSLPEDERERLLDTLTVANDAPLPQLPTGGPTQLADNPYSVQAPPQTKPVDKPGVGRQPVHQSPNQPGNAGKGEPPP